MMFVSRSKNIDYLLFSFKGFTLDDPSIGQRSYLLRAYSLKNLGKYNEALEGLIL